MNPQRIAKICQISPKWENFAKYGHTVTTTQYIENLLLWKTHFQIAIDKKALKYEQRNGALDSHATTSPTFCRRHEIVFYSFLSFFVVSNQVTF